MKAKLITLLSYQFERHEITNLEDFRMVELEVVLPNGDVICLEVNDGSSYNSKEPYIQVGLRKGEQDQGVWVLGGSVDTLLAGDDKLSHGNLAWSHPLRPNLARGAGMLGWHVHPRNPATKKADSIALKGK